MGQQLFSKPSCMGQQLFFESKAMGQELFLFYVMRSAPVPCIDNY